MFQTQSSLTFYLLQLLKKEGAFARLSTINLSGNQLMNEGVVNFIQALAHCKQLRHLNLSSCGMDHEAMDEVAQSLKSYRILTNLHLSDVNLGDAGALKSVAMTPSLTIADCGVPGNTC
mmetsp:Transcript_31200/g.48862  ORF Transcript_31200/g.48862 Transcript_31200/m.48862 type:complete len:119 (+) Transcript_31200:1141-1497(+)